MSIERKDLLEYLKNLLQVDTFPDVCINGLQVEGSKTIRSIAGAVTSSLNVIQKAKKLQVDALIVHHGLFLKGKDVVITGVLKEKIGLLINDGINLFAFHLPLDAHTEFGNNWPSARLLGMKKLQPFGKCDQMMIGVKGTFPKCTRSDFQKKLEKFYGHKARVAFGGKELVSSCAILSGNGHKWLSEAILSDVDCFVTGTNDEPIWHTAHEEKINFFSFGHAATEKIGIDLLCKHLKSQFGIKTTFIDEPNPF